MVSEQTMTAKERKREHMREYNRKRRADPEYRARELAQKRTRRATDPEYRARERAQERARYAYPEHRARRLVLAARSRARAKGLPYDLDQHMDSITWALEGGRCALTGVPFDFSAGRTWRSPSIDRIVPELGYVHGNVRVVCWGVNSALGEWGLAALKEMLCSWVRFDPAFAAEVRAAMNEATS